MRRGQKKCTPWITTLGLVISLLREGFDLVIIHKSNIFQPKQPLNAAQYLPGLLVSLCLKDSEHFIGFSSDSQYRNGTCVKQKYPFFD